jgi:hypothetical protein
MWSFFEYSIYSRQRFLISLTPLAKARLKYYASAGVVIDADVAARCLYDFYTMASSIFGLQKLLPLFLVADFSARDMNIVEPFLACSAQQYLLIV